VSGLNNRAYSIRIGKRGAFTLVEMLVVITLIGVLAALVAVAVTKVIGGQRRANTVGAIKTIQKVLNEHVAYVVAEARKEQGLAGPFALIDSVFGPDDTGGERNRIIWIKMRLIEAFPMSYAEVKWPPRPNQPLDGPFPYRAHIIPDNLKKYNSTYNKQLGGRAFDNFASPPKVPPPGPTESAACLLMALSIMRNGTALNLDNLGSNNVADTDGDGHMELIDGWGNPLVFFRFPTQNQTLQYSYPTTAAATKYADPLDPTGVLFNWKGGRRPFFESNVHAIQYGQPFLKPPPPPPPPGAYIVPTIVSAGPDGVLGLDASMKILPPGPNGSAEDNIYSFDLR
jgi:prepilin-type N-terminal cleavage/methylation domain-containing protein